MSDDPILVISDTHFGFEDESAQRFQRFMAYLVDSVRSGRMTFKKSHNRSDGAVETTLNEESVEAPKKIVLLGDILDLWISRDSNTLRPYQQSFEIFNSLIALNRQIVWLLGNHDGILGKYKGMHQLPGGTSFTVRPDTYPEKGSDGRCKGERIGRRTYVFIHGHQFDFFFRHGSVLRFGNFVGFSSASARDFRWFRWLGATVFALTVVVVLSPLLSTWLPGLLAWMAPQEQNSPLAVLTLFGGWLVGAIAFVGVLWLFTWLATWYYDFSHHPGHVQNEDNERERTLSEKILQRLRIQRRIGCHNFTRVAQRIDADVIVCGHTHEAFIKPYTLKDGSKKLIVNSGSWIVQRDNKHDTFVYVDDIGVRVLQWRDDGGYVLEMQSSLV